VVNENEEDMIRIPSKYDGVRMELGKSVNPQDIIDMYNELVASEGDSARLEKYEDGYFWNGIFEITLDVILDELNYAINGGEDEDEDYSPPVGKTGRVTDNEFVLLDSGLDKHRIIFNPKMNRYEFKNWTKNGSQGTAVLTDERLESLLDFLTKHK
jgi:hypothetical protein